ncbi:MAG: nitrous oxide reductase accessory protein NosL [Ignavibacteria bacterium]
MFNVVLMVALIFTSCSTDPEPLIYGKDQCDHCRMTIMDNKFGSEIITKKGKVYKFDAVECMIRFVKEGKLSEGEVSRYLVTDASKPAQFIDAKNAVYLISENFPSPMGADLSAYWNRADAENFRKQYSGEIKDWDGVLTKLNH